MREKLLKNAKPQINSNYGNNFIFLGLPFKPQYFRDVCLVMTVKKIDCVVIAIGANGFGAVRGLARSGLNVAVITQSPQDPSNFSKYPVDKKMVANLDADTLLNELRTYESFHPVLISTSDKSITFVCDHREKLLSNFSFCIPSDDLVNILIDKALETKYIQSYGVVLPKTMQGLPEKSKFLVATCGLPLIVKPRSFKFSKTLGKKNQICTTQEQVDRLYQDCRGKLDHLVAQEVIPGEDDQLWVANVCYGKSGKLLSGFTFRRLRLSPSHYGVTSYAISEYNEEVMHWAEVIGQKLGYCGPAMLEFKFDVRDHQYKYIEINPRLGMCNYFDTKCGINNALTTYYLSLEREDKVPMFGPQRNKVMYLCLYEDVYSRLKDGESVFFVLKHYASNFFKPHVGAYFDWQDLRPGLVMGWYDFSRTILSILNKVGLQCREIVLNINKKKKMRKGS